MNEYSVNDESVVKVQKKSKKLPKSVRPEEFIRLIQAVPVNDKASRIAFLMAYGSGMRISEVLRCTPNDFKPTHVFISESKYGVERIVPIPKGWKQVFLKELPLKISLRGLQRRFDKYSKIAGLPVEYSFHSLRHGFATRLLENGSPLNQIQVLMGHSNIATTSVYVKANPLDALKSYEKLF
jgi:integrase